MEEAMTQSFAIMPLPDVAGPGNVGETIHGASLPRKVMGTLGLVAAFGLLLLAPIRKPSPRRLLRSRPTSRRLRLPQPTGFDPTTAPAAELELYGYPRGRSNAPADAFTKWATLANPHCSASSLNFLRRTCTTGRPRT